MKKFFVKPISFVLVLFVLFGVFIFPTSAEGTETSGVIDGQVYSIVNVNSGKAWDVSAGNTVDNSDISQYTPTPSTYWQEWRIRYVGDGEYTIEDMHSRKLITNVNDNAAIYTANGSSAQRFRIVKNSDGTYTFLSKSSNYNKALGIYNSGTLNGDTLVFLNADSSNNQKHRLILSEEYGIIHERVYSFVNVGINKAIDVNAGGTAQGSGVGLYTYYHDTPWQRWKVMYVGNGDYEIVDMHSGLLLSVPGSSASVTNLWIYPRDYTDGQKFRFQRNTDGTVTIYSKSSDYKMALGWNGQVFVQYSEDNSANQKFKFVIAGCVYAFANKATARCIDVSNGNQPNGSDVAQFQRVDGRPWQEWKLRYIGNDMYTIMDMHSGKYLSIEGSSPNNDANAWIWEMDGTTGQQFRIQENSDGTLTFRTVCGESNNMVLTLPTNQDYTATLVQWTYDGSDNQKFYMTIECENEVPEGDYILKSKYLSRNMATFYEGQQYCELLRFGEEYGEQWRIEYDIDSCFRIKHINSNLYLTVPESTQNGKTIILDSKISTNRQLWKFTVVEYGYLKIQNFYHIVNGVDLILASGTSLNSEEVVKQRLNSEVINRGRWKPIAINLTHIDNGDLTQDIFFLGIPSSTGVHDHYSAFGIPFRFLTSLSDYDSINYHFGEVNDRNTCISYISNSNVFISRSHGGVFDDATATAIQLQSNPQVNLNSLDLVDIDGQRLADFSKCELILYIGCKTAFGGNNTNSSKNLITASVICGADCAVGFEDNIKCEPSNYWMEEFTIAYSNGVSVHEAAAIATYQTAAFYSDTDINDLGLNTYSIAE